MKHSCRHPPSKSRSLAHTHTNSHSHGHKLTQVPHQAHTRSHTHTHTPSHLLSHPGSSSSTHTDTTTPPHSLTHPGSSSSTATWRWCLATPLAPPAACASPTPPPWRRWARRWTGWRRRWGGWPGGAAAEAASDRILEGGVGGSWGWRCCGAGASYTDALPRTPSESVARSVAAAAAAAVAAAATAVREEEPCASHLAPTEKGQGGNYGRGFNFRC